MQYPPKASILTPVLLICVHYLTIQASLLDTLKQGDQLNSSSQLVSANGIFTLGFYTPQDTNNSYLALSYTSGPNSFKPVWIGNREQPVPSNTSRFLTIGTRGELIITHEGGEPIVLYAGLSGQNITATLLDSGNFVVNSNGASSVLWQSFDHPTDTLLPGMKIGVNQVRNWTLSSWFDPDNPAPGSYTLEWDPSISNLLVRQRGEPYWRSGKLKYYSDKEGKSRVDLDNIDSKNKPYFNFNFTRITSDEEDCLVFSVLPTPDREKVSEGWRLDYKGNILGTYSGVIAMPSLCYNYFGQKSAVSRGCERREQPKCRNEHQMFEPRYADFMPNKGHQVQIYDNNSRLSLSDCEEVCWNDCECIAYTIGTPGCLYWRGQNLGYLYRNGSSQKYFLESASSTKGMKKHGMTILTVVSSILLLILA